MSSVKCRFYYHRLHGLVPFFPLIPSFHWIFSSFTSSVCLGLMLSIPFFTTPLFIHHLYLSFIIYIYIYDLSKKISNSTALCSSTSLVWWIFLLLLERRCRRKLEKQQGELWVFPLRSLRWMTHGFVFCVYHLSGSKREEALYMLSYENGSYRFFLYNHIIIIIIL